MKLLRIVKSMNPANGGVVSAVDQFTISLKQKGFEVEVLSFDNPDSDYLREKSYKVHRVGRGWTSYGFNIKYIFWILKNAREYDFIVIDGLWQFHVFGGFLLKLLKVPYFIFVHGMLDPYFNKNIFKFIKKMPFWFLVERNVIKNSNAAIFTCEEEKILAKKSFPFYKAVEVVTPLGVDGPSKKIKGINIFLENYPDLKGKKIILYLSRIDQKKGCDLLIEAFFRLNRNDAYLVIAGPKNNKYCDFLEKKVKDLGVSNIIWTGMLQGEMKWAAFQASYAFCLPSHQENFGVVVAEALACSKPVLISNKVNIWREIEADNAGFVEDDTVEGTFKSLSMLLDLDQFSYLDMCKRSYSCYSKRFNIDNSSLYFVEALKDKLKPF